MACVLATVVLAGCGHSAPAKHAATPCIPAARAAAAGFLGVPASSISTTVSAGNNTYPQCAFRAVTGGTRVSAVANVDTGPQPYFILERTAIEAAQVFTANRLYPAPIPINLGIEADWFPATRQLMVTDGVRLISVTIGWGGVAQLRRRRLAIAIGRTYLRAPRKSAAKGFPSG
jgi:hypothetical protein